MTQPFVSNELREAERDYRASSRRTEGKRQHRNKLIQAALADGYTQRDIAKALGLSAGRVGQLAKDSHPKAC